MKRLIPFIAAVAVIFSALQLHSFASASYTGFAASVVYGNSSSSSHGFMIDGYDFIATCDNNNYGFTWNGINYTLRRYYSSVITAGSKTNIIIRSAETNDCYVMGVNAQIGSSGVWLYAGIRGTTNPYLGLGFNDYTISVDPSSYTEGTLNYALAVLYNQSKANNNVVPLERLAVIISGTTEFDLQSVNSGDIGYVYQGIITQDGTLLSSVRSNYHYNAENLIINFKLDKNFAGIPEYDNYWYLYCDGYEPFRIPRSGIGYNNYYSFSATAGDDYYQCTLGLSGRYVITSSRLDYYFIEQILWQLFDVEYIDTSRFVWCSPATIDQDQQQEIINREDVIIEQLDDIYNAIIGGDETAPSSPSEDQLVNMIDKSALENARSQINAFDVSAYAAAVSAILYINTAWANYPVFASAIILVGVGFLIFTIINGLKKK